MKTWVVSGNAPWICHGVEAETEEEAINIAIERVAGSLDDYSGALEDFDAEEEDE